MAKLYVVGGKQKQLAVKREEEWNLYESALILEVDTVSGAVEVCVEYKTPPEARAHRDSSSVFKSSTRVGNMLYACTNTEIITYRLPDFEVLNYVSLRCFNDVHHVTPSHDGNLLVVSTGLDMVLRMTPQGNVIEDWSVIDEPVWQRFSRDIDYRKIESTKPHRAHPNFVFELDNEVWVTRFQQRDAICLSRRGPRIAIDIERPHDGLVSGQDLFFTTVDGHLVIAGKACRSIKQIIDLRKVDDSDSLLGWCRGVLPQNADRCWVGFTRVRKTKILENILWVKRVFKEGMVEKPTHITLYSLSEMSRIQEIDLEAFGMNIIFSILPAHT